MILVWLILVYVSVYYFKEWLDRRKCPPGPWPVPILGTLIQIGQAGKEPHLAFSNIASEYKTDITRLKLGGGECVILSSYEAMTEVLNHPSTMSRPIDGIIYDRNAGERHGLVMQEGKSWEKRRAWLIKTLREFGFDKSGSMEVLALEFIEELLINIEKQIPSSGEGIVKVQNLFNLPVFKIMWKMICGQCTPEDEIIVNELLMKSEEMLKSGTFGTGIINVFPIAKYILPEWTGFRVQMDFYTGARKASRELLQKIGENMKKNEKGAKPKNLTEAYLFKMQDGQEPFDFHEQDFEVLFMDMMQGASDTTSSFLESCCLFAVLHPEIQAKVYKEIQETIPKGQNAAYSDLKNMIYTQAFFMEVHRCAQVLQLFVPRKSMTDFFYKKYFIKKDTLILTDTHTIFNDKKRFGKDTQVFRPERFITEDGELDDSKKYLAPFSVGKRNCPGEGLAEVTYFLFFIMILKKYKLSTVPGKTPPKREMMVTFTTRPFPFEIWVTKRVD